MGMVQPLTSVTIRDMNRVQRSSASIDTDAFPSMDSPFSLTMITGNKAFDLSLCRIHGINQPWRNNLLGLQSIQIHILYRLSLIHLLHQDRLVCLQERI